MKYRKRPVVIEVGTFVKWGSFGMCNMECGEEIAK